MIDNKTNMGNGLLREHLGALLLSVLATVFIFNGILNGNVIANCVHIFHFEPWAHYQDRISTTETVNAIFSDSVDGSDANLNPSNVEHFSIGKHLQASYLIFEGAKALWGHYPATTIECLLIFASMMFFLYLYLRLIGVNWPISIAIAMGFAFGGTNMHLHIGWAYESCCAVIALYFIERALRKNNWLNMLWVTLALVNLGGRGMVHIVAFYALFLVIYVLFRIANSPGLRLNLFIKFAAAGILSLLLSLDYLWPTINYFTTSFEKGHRESFGVRQNTRYSLFTLLFANFYGHPRLEPDRWISAFYINTAMFMGSITFLSAATFGLFRIVLQRDFQAIFFFFACCFGLLYAYEFPFERFEYLVGTLPILKWAPAIYFKAVLHLFIAVFGALGLQFAWELSKRYPRSYSYLVAVAIVAMLVIFNWGIEVYEYLVFLNKGTSEYLDAYMPKAIASALFSVLLATLIGFRSLIWRRRNEFVALALGGSLIAVVAYESRVHTDNWIPYSQNKNCFPPTQVTDFLRANVKNDRIIGLGHAAVPSMISKFSYGVEMAAGRMSVRWPYLLMLRLADPYAYQSHPTQYLFSKDTDLNSPVWDLANVRYFVTSRNLPPELLLNRHAPGSLKPHVLTDGIVIERTQRPRHAYLVHEAVIAETPEDMVSQVKEGLNVRKTVIVESEAAVLPEHATATVRGAHSRIKNFKKFKNGFELSVNARAQGYLFLSELYDRNWVAKIGDKELASFRAYHFLQGFHVPRGEHIIKISYQLPYQRLANLLVLVTVVCILALIAISIWRARNPKRLE